MTLDKKLGSVHEAVVDRLLERVQKTEVSTQDLKVAIDLLKYNNIQAARGDKPLADLNDGAAKKFDASEYPFQDLEPTPTHQTI